MGCNGAPLHTLASATPGPQLRVQALGPGTRWIWRILPLAECNERFVALERLVVARALVRVVVVFARPLVPITYAVVFVVEAEPPRH